MTTNARRYCALLVLLCGFAHPAWGEDCSEFANGVLDGATGAIPPSQIQIDRHCTIRNYPASNPLPTNFSFLTQPGQTNERWIVIFDNVVHTGQMACNAVAGHKIWFVNGSSTSIQEGCQNQLIPVEKIDKANPAGQSTATVGVPFTYTLTMPVLFDPATQVVINQAGSLNDLHGVTVTDDLNATGADLRYVSHQAYWQGSGAAVPHTFDDNGGLLTFDNFPIVPAGEQIILELTVVLTDTPANTIGTQFVNTAKWDFGRLIDGEFFEPLPGEWGISEPMIIAGPELVLRKSGPATLNLGVLGDFVLDVQNTGSSDAFQATLLDVLPDGPTGGMCDVAPAITAARVFASDGVTPVPGKGPLLEGTDFTASFDPGACELTLDLTSPASVIGAGERLLLTYQTRLDDDTQDAVALTNVAGVLQWFNGDASNPDRQTYTRTLTDGSVGVLDHEDAHTVNSALSGIFFEKTVRNLTSGADPATTAAPGDVLRYRLRVRTTDSPLPDFSIRDDLGARNAQAVFAPGSLAWVSATLPPGADISNTDSSGGSNQAGLVDVRSLSLPAASEVTLEFDVTLQPAITNGTLVTNQARLTSAAETLDSDDPNVNGLAYPDIAGDEDPTVVQIVSAPLFDVDKISSYLDGDPAVLLAGEALRYTITIRNIGTEDATGVLLRDQIPGNTTYIAGSTTLNGVAVADINGGSPLSGGLAINAPRDTTPGNLPADASDATEAGDATATVTFDVRVAPDLIDGTIISNQAFLDAPDAGMVGVPSDDPRTAVADDPTRDVVGNVPLLFAEKSALLLIDNDSPGIVDPGDTLRYTITVYNNSATPATAVRLQDGVPGNTSYVADTTFVNGEPAAQPDSGVFPLQGFLPISSADLTPPLPGDGEGVLSPGASATVQFDLLVALGTPRGTIISNQADVYSAEAQPLPTDGDGDPSTGPEPTIVIVGDAQQLRISKQVAVVGGGAAEAGDTLEYLIRVRNAAPVPAYGVIVTDDLDYPVAGQLAFVPDSVTVNGNTTGVDIMGSVLTVDYSANYGPLQPGEEIQIRFQALIDDALPIGTTVSNRAVVTWNTDQSAEAVVSIDIGGVVGSGMLSGTAWHDANFDNVLDVGEPLLTGWSVELYRNDSVLMSTVTAPDGTYLLQGVPPNYLTPDTYRLVFAAPDAGSSTAKLGLAYSADFTNGLQEISDIVVRSGSNLINLNLPIDPNGTVYDALSRAPLAGVTLTLLDAQGNALPSNCFDDPAQQQQVSGAAGHYKFDLNFASPACPSGTTYRIAMTPPGEAFVQGYSELIPPASTAGTPLDVPGCPLSANDAVVSTDGFCEVQADIQPPSQAFAFASPATAYHVHLVLDANDVPGSSQVFNNHLPVDPVLTGVVSVQKHTPMVDVRRGQLVPYTISVANTYEIDLIGVDVVDRFPPGFHYVEGSARFDGVVLEPEQTTRELRWPGLTLAAEGRHTIELLLGVGAGVGEGEYVNRAFAANTATGAAMSGEGTATVRLVPDPTFDCTDVTGKVFDDENNNGRQDALEPGLANVQVVTARGLLAITDRHGRFHFTCPIIANELRGSNFALKVDDRTLPSGYRSSKDLVQVQRATRGKSLHFSFGASIHRVIGLDLADPVFEPGSTEVRPQWLPRFAVLMEELQKAPAILRLSYLADTEPKRLVNARLRTLRRRIADEWAAINCCDALEIESRVFWRLGAPATQAVDRVVKRERGR